MGSHARPPVVSPSSVRRIGRACGRLAGFLLAGLVVLLVAASPAAAAHPSAGSPQTGSGPTTIPGGALPALPATAALACLVVLTVPGRVIVRRWRSVAAVVTAGLLVGFAGETALHSAHHVGEPAEAEQCLVSSACQHLPTLDPEPALPVLERPAPTTVAPLPIPPAVVAVVLDAEQARAPPHRPA